jgi:hypothetical protein
MFTVKGGQWTVNGWAVISNSADPEEFMRTQKRQKW